MGFDTSMVWKKMEVERRLICDLQFDLDMEIWSEWKI